MLLKDSEDTIVMPANCSDKISSNLNNGGLSPINENHENEILHKNLCSVPKSINSSKISPCTSPFPTVNISPENVLPYNLADRQQTLRYPSNETCFDDLCILEPKPAPHE